MDRPIVVKFQTNIANRWLFMIQIKIMVIILYSWSYFDMFGGRFFRTRCISNYNHKIIIMATRMEKKRKKMEEWGWKWWSPTTDSDVV